MNIGFRFFQLIIIILVLIFFTKILVKILQFLDFPFESYSMYISIFIAIMLFVAVLPDTKYKYGVFLN